MKKIILTMMLFAVAAIAFDSCQKPEIESNGSTFDLTFTSEKPDLVTRTEWTGETVRWSAGDAVKVGYIYNGSWNSALYSSDALAQAASVAKFTVKNFSGSGSGSYVFHGVYPAGAVSSANVAGGSVEVMIPSEQYPDADSFDAAADLMAGQSVALEGIPENRELSMAWTRLVAHAEFNLNAINGLGEDEAIAAVIFTANEDADMVGSHSLDLATGTVGAGSGGNNILTIEGAYLKQEAGSIKVWAGFLPCTITSLKVVVETDEAYYTREITSISRKFEQNRRNVLPIDMSSAVRTEKKIEFPEFVKIVGGATPYGWDLNDSPAVYPVSEGVYNISDITMHFDKAGGHTFKVYLRNEANTDTRVALQKPNSDFGSIAVYSRDENTEDGAHEFNADEDVYPSGIYDITVDFNEMKLTLVRIGDIPEVEPEALYILGSCLPWPWSWDSGERPLEKVNPGIYRVEGVALDCTGGNGFKVYPTHGTWEEYQMTADSAKDNIKLEPKDNNDRQIRPGDLGYESGTYDIEINWTAKTLTLTKKSDAPAKVYPEKLYVCGGCFYDADWSVFHPLDKVEGEGNIYRASNMSITFAYEGCGFKLLTEAAWSTEYQMTADSTYGNIKLEVHSGDPDRQIMPDVLGYESGTYDIEVDWDAMTMTLTKK